MKAIIAKNKKVEIVRTDIPVVKPAYLLIKTIYSAISPGTELSAIHISNGREINLGYSAVGVVEQCGEGVEDFQQGDLIACYGAPYVRHAEYLHVPITLCSKVPRNVDPKEAALGGLGAIAIHALRIANLSFGEKVVVAGLGIIGQLIAQIADAAAYDVFAYDLSNARTELLGVNQNIKRFTERTKLEKELGIEEKYRGADAVLLCAGGKNSPLTDQSLSWIRDKGKVIIVGDIEPDFPREKMFSKEASIFISRAGGPGRYDSTYEREAIDYPYGFIRWTEGRNIEEYLRLVSEKRIDVSAYLTEEVDFSEIGLAYEELENKDTAILTKVIKYA